MLKFDWVDKKYYIYVLALFFNRNTHSKNHFLAFFSFYLNLNSLFSISIYFWIQRNQRDLFTISRKYEFNIEFNIQSKISIIPIILFETSPKYTEKLYFYFISFNLVYFVK